MGKLRFQIGVTSLVIQFVRIICVRHQLEKVRTIYTAAIIQLQVLLFFKVLCNKYAREQADGITVAVMIFPDLVAIIAAAFSTQTQLVIEFIFYFLRESDITCIYIIRIVERIAQLRFEIPIDSIPLKTLKPAYLRSCTAFPFHVFIDRVNKIGLCNDKLVFAATVNM